MPTAAAALIARAGLAVVVQRTDANPVVQRLQGQMQVFVGLEFDNRQPSVAVEREQVEHAAVADGERRHLRIQQVAAQPGQQLGNARAQPRLKPALRLQAEQRIGVRAIRVPAAERAVQKVRGKALHSPRSAASRWLPRQR